LLVHDLLVERGVRERSTIQLVMPFSTPIPPSPAASSALLTTFAERRIEWVPEHRVEALDAGSGTALLSGDVRLDFDLFLGVPVHCAPRVVVDSGMTVDGWIPVDPLTLQTRFPDVYALGDVTSVGTPKAGVFSEGQAIVAAERIIATLRGEQPETTYDGHGLCYLEFGHDMVAKVDVTFMAGQAPTGDLLGPSPELVPDKGEFGTSRIQRWFGREWSALG